MDRFAVPLSHEIIPAVKTKNFKREDTKVAVALAVILFFEELLNEKSRLEEQLHHCSVHITALGQRISQLTDGMQNTLRQNQRLMEENKILTQQLWGAEVHDVRSQSGHPTLPYLDPPHACSASRPHHQS